MLTAFHLKVIAFSLMIIDHTGRLFFPQVHIMVALGRLSFPLFAYLVAMGAKHSRNIKNYLLRLILLGILSQPIYAYFFNILFQQSAPLNILFGLAMGVVTLRSLKHFKNPVQKLAVILLIPGLGGVANIEGGITTVPTIVFMSTFQNSMIWWLSYTCFEMAGVWILLYPPITLFRLFAPLILLKHNGRQGPKSRLFYLIYPLHFLVLIGIHQVV